MSLTDNLKLPFILSGQAQKHVTHNEAIRMLDAVVQLSVISANTNIPPVTPDKGDRYIVGATPSGEWEGKANQLAVFVDGAWMYLLPQAGWLAWVRNAQSLFVYQLDMSGEPEWAELSTSNSSDAVQQLDLLGINTSADAINEFSVRSEGSLFSHDGADHRMAINKNNEVDTASILFQSGFIGHAEMGLTAGNDFQIKTSVDGSIWTTALRVDPNTSRTRVKSFYSGEVSVDENGVVEIPTPSTGGFLLIMMTDDTYPQTGHCGLLHMIRVRLWLCLV